jgi:hypothetical protein
MPMLDLDIAKTKTLIDELRFAGDHARKAKDTAKAKDIDNKYNAAIAKLRALQARKASAVQNGRGYRDHGREIPHPETPYRPVGPAQAVGGNIVQGVGMRMKAKRKTRRRKTAPRKKSSRGRKK